MLCRTVEIREHGKFVKVVCMENVVIVVTSWVLCDNTIIFNKFCFAFSSIQLGQNVYLWKTVDKLRKINFVFTLWRMDKFDIT